MGILELEVLNDSVKIVRSLLNDTKYNFVAIGYYLRKIDDDKLYRESGHDNIWNFAKDQFGLSKSSASRFMAINKRFSVDGYSDKLADNYQQFNVSQMSEMLTLTDEQIGQIDASTTIREIRDMKPKPEKKEDPVEEPMEGQMVFDDYPGVVPEKEVVATSQQDDVQIARDEEVLTENVEDSESCEDYGNCFSCSKECDSRQELRYCVDAPLGNPFSCTTMNVIENLKDDVGIQCEFVNQDAAYHRPGDGEASPCCKHCKNTNCGYRCRRAMKTVGEGTEHSADDESNVMIDNPEFYTNQDVQYYLKRAEDNLNLCRKEDVKSEIRKHTAINVDSYRCLLENMNDNDDSINDSNGFEMKIQELPVLKNNDQRGDFIDNFESWPLWIDCKETDEKIYRYDLGEGIALAVREKLRHKWITGKYKYSETETEYAGHEFYLIGVEGKYGNSGYEFRINSNRTFYESLVNRSMLIEFIKKYQKGEVK